MGNSISRKSGTTFEWIGCDNSIVCSISISLSFVSLTNSNLFYLVRIEYQVNFIFPWKIYQNPLFVLQHQHFHRQHHRLCRHAVVIHCIAPNAQSNRPNCRSLKIQHFYWNALLKPMATKMMWCQRDQPRSKCVEYVHFKCSCNVEYARKWEINFGNKSPTPSINNFDRILFLFWIQLRQTWTLDKCHRPIQYTILYRQQRSQIRKKTLSTKKKPESP